VEQTTRYSIQVARDAALHLHRALFESVRLDYEREHGRVENPASLLQLLIEDPTFAWLRGLSSRLVALDDVLAEPEVGIAQAAAVRSELEQALAEPEFESRYLPQMQGAPDVVLAHAQLQRALADLPPAIAFANRALSLLGSGRIIEA
jgi:hypothetical protein